MERWVDDLCEALPVSFSPVIPGTLQGYVLGEVRNVPFGQNGRVVREMRVC